MPSQRDGGSCVSPLADADAYASHALALESLSSSSPEKKEVSPAMPVEEHKPIDAEVRIALPSQSLYSLVPAFPLSSQPFPGLFPSPRECTSGKLTPSTDGSQRSCSHRESSRDNPLPA